MKNIIYDNEKKLKKKFKTMCSAVYFFNHLYILIVFRHEPYIINITTSLLMSVSSQLYSVQIHLNVMFVNITSRNYVKN